ncbi:MAG: RHS repeat-associated core domain-containing protein [Dehalococcoidia bacterium]
MRLFEGATHADLGNVTDSYTYDLFRALRSQTGATANDFRYTGQQNDANAARGLYYLRARAYGPGLGRFVQRDRLSLLQPYAYAGNQPVDLSDPSGAFPSGIGREMHIREFLLAVGAGLDCSSAIILRSGAVRARPADSSALCACCTLAQI